MQTKKSKVFEINAEIRDLLLEQGASDAYKCYQCAKCTSVCPWFQVGTYEFLPYRFPVETILGFIASSEEKEELLKEVDRIYRCVGCEACVKECPFMINIPNILRAARRILVDFGSYPETLKSVVQRLRNVGNPVGAKREERGNWTKGLNVKEFEHGMEFLYFAGCIPAYDQRVQLVAKATAGILQKSGIAFGILGEKENCCGEAIRRVGAESLFKELAKTNITAFKDQGIKKIVVTSPHCYTTFKKEYPEFGYEFEVQHISQVLAELIAKAKLKPVREFNKKVVYHDPCTLGRQNDIYDEPRRVLKSMPGLKLLEVEEFSHHLSVCCGAGSGALWMDWETDERIANVRVKQLLNTGAELIAVACPYCLQMFEETLKSMNVGVPVMDIAEIVYESLA